MRTEILIMLSSLNYHAICYFSIKNAPCNVKDLPTEGLSDVICLNNVYTTLMWWKKTRKKPTMILSRAHTSAKAPQLPFVLTHRHQSPECAWWFQSRSVNYSLRDLRKCREMLAMLKKGRKLQRSVPSNQHYMTFFLSPTTNMILKLLASKSRWWYSVS